MSTSTLENEDLDNGPLVRMEDVQPARDRPCEVFRLEENKTEPIETYIVDHLDYDNECVVDDDDSNIGSMVSIHSEDVVECDDSSDSELIVPEIQPVKTSSVKLEFPSKVESKTPPERWPTLEILPGGVIKHSDKCDDELSSLYQNLGNESENDNRDKMYACAKCSQSFKYLYNLVKHVRGHEKEQKKLKASVDLTNLTSLEKELVHLKRASIELDRSYKKQKVEVLARIAAAIAQIENVEDFFDK
ncbi:hypothetical protein evm_001490 [Chilo suppressalis]|nr:hypothetical protein evm_001490 [Chilo suppressalis]